MNKFLLYLIVLTIIFVLYLVFIFLIQLKKDTLGKDKAFLFIQKKYKLSMNKSKVRKLSFLITLTNSFILSIPTYLAIIIDVSMIWIIVISLFTFMLLMFSLYNLIGFILKKRGW